MNRLRTFLVLVAALAPAAARAGDFEDFQSICVQTEAQPGAITAAADAKGWTPLPDAIMDQFKNTDMHATVGRLRSGSDGLRFVLAATGERRLNGATMRLDVCALGAAPAAAALKDQVASWAAVPPNAALSTGGNTTYTFVDGPGGHQPVLTEKDAQAQLASHRLNTVFVQSNDKLTMVGFGVAAK